ncbi:MAG TPA: hypothetical protein VFI24_26020 [Pyrinomonadaceae bacterium]|nr:hypothetical protein [Pyrinomonadaceae bacterium]
MRKNFVSLSIIAGLLIAGGAIVTVSNRVSVSTVLKTHGAYNVKLRSKYTQTATLTYFTNGSTGLQRVLDVKLKLSVNDTFARYDQTTFDGSQSYLLDGQNLIRSDAGIKQEVKTLDATEAAAIKFQISTFGLLPMLKRISDQRSQVSYVGRTAKGHRFQVKTSKGSWYFYANSNHLIDRLEIENINITFGDYRTVQGMKLPFYQQVKKADKLLYEIKFDTFEFNPVFAADFFKSAAL